MIMAVKAAAGIFLIGSISALLAQQAEHAGPYWWVPVVSVIGGLLSAVIPLWINNRSLSKRLARRQDLQAPVREAHLFKLVSDEGEQIRKELRLQIEFQQGEITKQRATIESLETRIQKLITELLKAENDLREARAELYRMQREQKDQLKGTGS